MTVALSAGATTCDLSNPGDVLMIQAAPDVVHFHPSPEHADRSWMLGVEWQCASRWLAGYTYFNNSFDQRSHYAYVGKWWQLAESSPNWYVKLSGGVIVGYKEPYEDKIPYNHNGVAPGIVPAIGYKFDRVSIQLNLLGVSALMITFGYDLIRK